MNLTIGDDDARLLKKHLDDHLRRLDADLVRTDNPDLQHAFAREIERLRAIAARIDASIGAGASESRMV